MIVVVDGTGPDDDAVYAAQMQNSFCSQIATGAGGVYFRGPTLLGSEVSAIADRAVGAALKLAASGQPIRLAGYSRGGCTVINATARLKARGKRVAAMFLFDAVDMQFSAANSTQFIPDNVDYVAHVRGERSISFYARNPNISRWYFINTGRWLSGNGTMDEKTFVGTHGAIGGVGAASVPTDGACAMAVANWMSPLLQSHGIGITLRA